MIYQYLIKIDKSETIIHMYTNQSQEQNNIDGFESEIEPDEQEIGPVNQFHEISDSIQQNQGHKLPPGRSIINDNYSLFPDIVTGWNGPQKCSHPIPITVQAPYFDAFFTYLLEGRSPQNKICYFGPRYDNTFFAWFKMPFDFPYTHLQPPTGMKFTNRPFVEQHQDFRQDHIIFDSFFESGNLDCSVYVGDNQYDLFLRVDSNTRGHFQWYNFTIRNLKPHQKYKINICNLQKDYSLYSRGMKPYILSAKAKEKTGKDWEQRGENVKYQKKICKSMANYQRFKYFYQLSFQISSKYQDDLLQIAYCIPYTLTDLQKFLLELKKKIIGGRFYSETKLCKSLGGIPLPLITIAEELNEQVDSAQRKLKKKCIILAGRVHPGQSNSSYAMEGFLNFICSNNKAAKYLRANIVFKIVPMLNPDGVSFGNYRTGLSGKDFNREYLKPDHTLFPQVSNLKKLVYDYKRKFGNNLLMFIDFHGHATKKNAFMFGPQYNLAQKYYYQSRMLPRILSKRTKIFRYYSCIFKIEPEKKNTARAIFLYNLGINLSYTLEISNYCYYDTDQLLNYSFEKSHFIQMGIQLGQGISDYLSLIRASQMIRAQKLRKRQLEKSKQNSIYSKKNKPVEQQKKRSPKKNTSKDYKFKFGKVQNFDNEEDDQDFMNYIYQEIEAAQKQKMEWKQKMKAQSKDNIQDQQQYTDNQDYEDDLEEEQLKLIYKCIKSKNKESYDSTIFQEHNDRKIQNNQKSNFESIQSLKPKHRRVQSVKIYSRSERKKTMNVKQPTRIMIGTEMKEQHGKVFRIPGESRNLQSYKDSKQKPKTFQQFIATQKNNEKQGKKTKSQKKIYGKMPLMKIQDIQSSSEIGSILLSPRKYYSPERQKPKITTFEQKKMEIYKAIQRKRQKQKTSPTKQEQSMKDYKFV